MTKCFGFTLLKLEHSSDDEVNVYKLLFREWFFCSIYELEWQDFELLRV